MKRFSRIITTCTALLLSFSVLSGCGTKTETPPTPAPEQSTEAPAATDAPATEAAATEAAATEAAAEGETPTAFSGTININTQTGPGLKEAWQGVADGYMAKNPGVKVVVDLKPTEGYAEWLQNIFNTANPETDIANVNVAIEASTGKVINFLEYVDDESSYSGKPWNEQFNYQMQGRDLSRNEWTNISLESVQVLWCYNKDIFEKAGVQPPTTWDEFVTVCQKLQDAGYQPIACAGDFNSFWAGQMGWLAQVYADQTTRGIVDIVRAQKGDYCYDPAVDDNFKLDVTDPYNDDSWKVNQNLLRAMRAIRDGEYKPDTDGMKSVWTNFAKIFPKYAGGDAFFGTKDALPMFYQGKAAILLDGAWRLGGYTSDMKKMEAGQEVMSGETKIEGIQKFNIGTFNMPSMEGPGFVAKARTIEVAVGFVGAVKKDKAHDDMVVDFMKYYSSAEGFSKYLDKGLANGLNPAGPPLVYGVELPAEYQKLFSELKFIGNVQKGYGGCMSRGAPSDVQQSLRDWYDYSQSFLTGKITVDEWVTKHAANIKKYFNDSLKAYRINPSDLDNPQNAPTGQ